MNDYTSGTIRKPADELDSDTRLSNIVAVGLVVIFASLSCIVLVMI